MNDCGYKRLMAEGMVQYISYAECTCLYIEQTYSYTDRSDQQVQTHASS